MTATILDWRGPKVPTETAMGAPPVSHEGEGCGCLVTHNGATPEAYYVWQDETWVWHEALPSGRTRYVSDCEIIAWSTDQSEAARLYAAYAEAFEAGDEDPVDVVSRMLTASQAVAA